MDLTELQKILLDMDLTEIQKLTELQKMLLDIQKENKRLRRGNKHYVTKDGRHRTDYGIRAGNAMIIKDRNDRFRCFTCGRFAREPRRI